MNEQPWKLTLKFTGTTNVVLRESCFTCPHLDRPVRCVVGIADFRDVRKLPWTIVTSSLCALAIQIKLARLNEDECAPLFSGGRNSVARTISNVIINARGPAEMFGFTLSYRSLLTRIVHAPNYRRRHLPEELYLQYGAFPDPNDIEIIVNKHVILDPIALANLRDSFVSLTENHAGSRNTFLMLNAA